VCWENFNCNCIDSTKAGIACKHIHALVIFLEPIVLPSMFINSTADVSLADADATLIEAELPEFDADPQPGPSAPPSSSTCKKLFKTFNQVQIIEQENT
jgi:hypothetical protein